MTTLRTCTQVRAVSMQYLSHYWKYVIHLYPSEGSKHTIPITLLETCHTLVSIMVHKVVVLQGLRIQEQGLGRKLQDLCWQD
jgi:hypothetical protein